MIALPTHIFSLSTKSAVKVGIVGLMTIFVVFSVWKQKNEETAYSHKQVMIPRPFNRYEHGVTFL